jgi:protein transport protein SEC24
VQVVDLGELGPVRCQRCKAYMNCFMRWVDSGKAFVCNFCGCSNPCPEPYFNYLGPDGRRRDAYERAELNAGTYEVKGGGVLGSWQVCGYVAASTQQWSWGMHNV